MQDRSLVSSEHLPFKIYWTKLRSNRLKMILKVTLKTQSDMSCASLKKPMLLLQWGLMAGVGFTAVAFSNGAWMSRPSLLSSMQGVKNADENELQEIASEPDSTHVYNVAEFDLMHTVVESLTRTVCSRVEEQDKEIKGKTRDRACGCPPVQKATVDYENSRHFSCWLFK